jgi:hypothetical protein
MFSIPSFFFLFRNYISTGCVLQNNAISNVWGSIRFQEMDPNVLIYTDRCCLHYIDTRVRIREILNFYFNLV